MTNKKAPCLILFDGKHLILIGLLLSAFALLVLCRIHGYSMTCWKDYIGVDSEKKEILFGRDRPIRSDDWAVEIPLMLAQTAHDPQFPLVNEKIGNGMNMAFFAKIPVKNPLALFRPTTWGFFLGKDQGLSWMWWTMLMGMFYVYFLVFMLISKNRLSLSFWSSAFLLLSPYFQFWSYHTIEIPLFMGLVFVSLSYVCFHRGKTIILVHGFLLGWALACFAFHYVYPPFQVSCAYLLLFLIIGLAADRHRDFSVRLHMGYRIFGMLAALTILMYAASVYFNLSKETIAIMMKTTFPGTRFETGGRFDLWYLFRNNFFITPLLQIAGTGWGRLLNVCESGSFWFFFPLFYAALFWTMWRHRRIDDRFSMVLLGYFLILIVFLFFGFPETLARYTLFSMMPPERSIVGLGIANVILMVSFLSRDIQLTRTERLVSALLWALFLLYCSPGYDRYLETGITTRYMLGISLLNGAIAFFLLDVGPRRIVAVLAGIAFLAGAWFNPLVVGGTAYLYENRLSRQILEMNERHQGNTRWAVYGSWAVANLLRILNVSSITGSYPYPQLDLWGRIDPDRRYVPVYNRLAHIDFMPARGGDAIFRSPSPDRVTVFADPSAGLFARLGVTHILVVGRDTGIFDHCAGLKRVYSLLDKHIYQVNPP